jgi:hypothetical protein
MFWEESDCGEHQTCRAAACDCVADCVPCADECSEGSCDVRCDGDAVVACAGPDEDGCTYWEDPEPCEPGLLCKDQVAPIEAAACIPPEPSGCTSVHGCDFDGQQRCYDDDPTRYRLCYINPDNGCLKLDCGT